MQDKKSKLKQIFGKYYDVYYQEIPLDNYLSKQIKGYMLFLKIWTDEIEEFILKYKIEGIALNLTEKFSFSMIKDMYWLKYLSFNSQYITDIKYLKELKDLEYLMIYGAKYNNFDFSIFKRLKKCDISIKKGNMSLYNCLTLESLDINYKEEDCMPLSNLVNLKYLILNASNLKSLNGLDRLEYLEYIEIHNAKIEDVGINWEKLSRLKNLSFINCKNLITIKGIEKSSNIKSLKLQNCVNLKSIENIKDLKFLVIIDLIDMSKDLKGFNAILKLTKLEEFNTGFSSNFTSLEIFQNCKNLKKLMLWGCKNVDIMNNLSYIGTIEKLILDRFGTIESLKPIVQLDKLKSFQFTFTTIKDKDIKCLQDCKSLERTVFDNNSQYNISETELNKLLKQNQKKSMGKTS